MWNFFLKNTKKKRLTGHDFVTPSHCSTMSHGPLAARHTLSAVFNESIGQYVAKNDFFFKKNIN